MKTKSIGTNVCKQLGLNDSELVALLDSTLSSNTTCILCADGKVLPDTRKNRSDYHGKGAHIITNKCEVRKIPFTMYVAKSVKSVYTKQCAITSIGASMIETEQTEVRQEVRLESERQIFNICKGVRTRKRCQRGGAGFAEMQKLTNCVTETTKRPWGRGERVKTRNANKREEERVRRENHILGIIRISKVGLIWRSEPKATKANCGRNIF